MFSENYHQNVSEIWEEGGSFGEFFLQTGAAAAYDLQEFRKSDTACDAAATSDAEIRIACILEQGEFVD